MREQERAREPKPRKAPGEEAIVREKSTDAWLDESGDGESGQVRRLH